VRDQIDDTEAITNDPAVTFIQTGHQRPGGQAWRLAQLWHWQRQPANPAFIVMVSQGSGNKTDQAPLGALLGQRLPAGRHQGVRFRSGSDPVLYLSILRVDAAARRRMLEQRRQTQ